MKRFFICIFILSLTVICSVSCTNKSAEDTAALVVTETTPVPTVIDIIPDNIVSPEAVEEENISIIVPSGMTMETRILAPKGYNRVEVSSDSFAQFLRSYPLKEYGSKVLLYDGSEKYNQNVHVSVFALPLENYDLQQCADSVIRMYAEYYYSTGQYDKIAFHYTNGFLAEYSKWREGQRIKVDGNDVYWVVGSGYDDSYDCFVSYLKNVFTYAGTLSMNSESKEISLSESESGDVFLYGGSPGHVVMIVDVCINENGEKAFLLAQGYMPAQEFHILVNENHIEDPWYYEHEITYPFVTPEYVFDEGSLRTLD